MIEIGKFNHLTANRFTDNGCYLMDEKEEEVLLPNKYVPEGFKEGDEIDVFIFLDFEERVTATTIKPKIELYGFACLEVVDINDIGAFLDWGLEKHLFCSFREQNFRLEVGGSYVFYMYMDGMSNRLAASTSIDKFIEKENIDLYATQEVDLLIQSRTDLGYNAIVNNKYLGLIYENEIFKPIRIGDEMKGYVKQLREDNKIDLRLEKFGYNAVEPNAKIILEFIRNNKGELKLTDKSSPEEIKEQFQMSKKIFKKAIGSLYKDKVVRLEKDGIYLI